MNANELATKFAEKVAAGHAEAGRQQAASRDDNLKHMHDVPHCKRAMTDDVVPFLEEIKSEFPEGQFSFETFVDHEDHKVVSVSFRIGDGPPTVITTFFGTIILAHAGASGSSKGVDFIYPSDTEPYISNSGDLTRAKIGKLVSMIIENG